MALPYPFLLCSASASWPLKFHLAKVVTRWKLILIYASINLEVHETRRSKLEMSTPQQ